MRRWVPIVLAGTICGCFEDPANVGDAAGGSSSTAATVDSSSTGTPTTASSGDAVDSSSGEPSTDASSDSGCAEGQAGCPCVQDPMSPAACAVGSTCVADVCEAMPSACLVSYGGGDAGLEFRVASIYRNGDITVEPPASFMGMHDIPEATRGQDMLVGCGGHLFAVLAETASVFPLRLQPDRTLTMVGAPLQLPEHNGAGERSLRALECAHGDRLVTVVTFDPRGAASPEVHVRGVTVDNDGTFGVGIGEPAAFELGDGNPVPLAIRTAWSDVHQQLYLTYDMGDVQAVQAHRFAVDENSGAVTLITQTPHVFGNLSGAVGALAIDPLGDVLIAAGVLTPMPGLAAIPVNGDGSVGTPPTVLPDLGGPPVLGPASSAAITDLTLYPGVALVAGPGTIAFVDPSAVAPDLLDVRNTSGAGRSGAHAAHEGEVLVAADATGVETFDATDIALEQLDTAPAPIASYSASVLVPCPPP